MDQVGLSRKNLDSTTPHRMHSAPRRMANKMMVPLAAPSVFLPRGVLMPLVPTRPLDVALMRAALVDTPTTTWQSLEVADVTGSTNSDMVQRATTDPTCDRALLLAEYQTNGRGRYTRSFVAPFFHQFLGSYPHTYGHAPTMGAAAFSNGGGSD